MKHSARAQYGLDWQVPDLDNRGQSFEHGTVHTILLQEIRDELKALNRLLGCTNFLDIPATLRAIRRNTAKPRRRRSTP